MKADSQKWYLSNNLGLALIVLAAIATGVIFLSEDSDVTKLSAQRQQKKSSISVPR